MENKNIHEVFDQDDYVTIKCNKCGRKIGFFPIRVMHIHECDCGNNNTGSPSYDWPNLKFGDYTFVKKEKLRFSIS